MSSDGLIEFIENGYDKLVEGFIEKHRDLWEDFTFKMYEEQCVAQIDHAKDIGAEPITQEDRADHVAGDHD